MSLSRIDRKLSLIPKEGEPLKYFENKERYLGYAKEGEKERVWYLCTPYFGDSGDGVWWLVWEEA